MVQPLWRHFLGLRHKALWVWRYPEVFGLQWPTKVQGVLQVLLFQQQQGTKGQITVSIKTNCQFQDLDGFDSSIFWTAGLLWKFFATCGVETWDRDFGELVECKEEMQLSSIQNFRLDTTKTGGNGRTQCTIDRFTKGLLSSFDWRRSFLMEAYIALDIPQKKFAQMSLLPWVLALVFLGGVGSSQSPKNGPKMTFWYLGVSTWDQNRKKNAARFLQFLT